MLGERGGLGAPSPAGRDFPLAAQDMRRLAVCGLLAAVAGQDGGTSRIYITPTSDGFIDNHAFTASMSSTYSPHFASPHERPPREVGNCFKHTGQIDTQNQGPLCQTHIEYDSCDLWCDPNGVCSQDDCGTTNPWIQAKYPATYDNGQVLITTIQLTKRLDPDQTNSVNYDFTEPNPGWNESPFPVFDAMTRLLPLKVAITSAEKDSTLKGRSPVEYCQGIPGFPEPVGDMDTCLSVFGPTCSSCNPSNKTDMTCGNPAQLERQFYLTMYGCEDKFEDLKGKATWVTIWAPGSAIQLSLHVARQGPTVPRPSPTSAGTIESSTCRILPSTCRRCCRRRRLQPMCSRTRTSTLLTAASPTSAAAMASTTTSSRRHPSRSTSRRATPPAPGRARYQSLAASPRRVPCAPREPHHPFRPPVPDRGRVLPPTRPEAAR